MRWNLLLIVLFSLFLSACASKKKASRARQDRPARQTEHRDRQTGHRDGQTGHRDRQTSANQAPSRSLNTEEYIRIYSSMAVEEMQRSGVPASITLAQGILESGNGNSRLARQANNHFGIKCTSDWNGGRTYKDDDRRNDCFRVYASAKESFRDHSRFLQRGRYAFLFKLKITDYKGWARGLKRAGYATNPRYAQLLISLIERYELYYFDRPQNRKQQKALAKNEKPLEEAGESPTGRSATAGTPSAAGKAPSPAAGTPSAAAGTPSPAAGTPGAVAGTPSAAAGTPSPRGGSAGAVAGSPRPAAGTKSVSGATADGTAAGTTVASEPVSTSHYYYTVKPGDTLFAISRRFDITVDELRAWNSLSSNAISGGQRLRVSR